MLHAEWLFAAPPQFLNAKMASELFKIWMKLRNPVVAVFLDEKKHFINIKKENF